MKKRTIFIATSSFTSTINYQFKRLGEEFTKDNINVVFILDCPNHLLPINRNKITYYNWPSKRPTKIKDFIFLFKLIKKYKPYMTMSMFGSGNIMTLIAFFFRVKNRIIWIRTTSQQTEIDSDNKLKYKFLITRKRIIYRLNTHIYTNSKRTLIDSINKKFVKNQNTGVYTNLFSPSNIKYINLKDRSQSIIIAGRLHKSKGHIKLIKQFKDVLSEFPDIKLKIIGNGNLKEEIISYSKKNNVFDNIVFINSLPQKELFVTFANSLVIINSSVSESFGNTMVESLREGTPVLATKTEGSTEIINNKNGLFYSNDIKFSLLKNLNKVMNNWESYSENAITSFNENFNIDSKISSYSNNMLKEYK